MFRTLAMLAKGLLGPCVILGSFAQGGVIVEDSSASECCGPAISDNGAAEISWTQAGTYTDVVVSVPLYSYTGGQIFHISAYLTTSIGPSATPPALASTTESFSTPFASPEETILFSGLTLGPGTYYLTLFGSDSAAGPNGAIWVGSEASGAAATIMTAPGVTVSSAYQANGGILDGFYAPASSFILAASGDSGFSSYDFTVTGVFVPEAPPALELMLGFAALAMLRRANCGARGGHNT